MKTYTNPVEEILPFFNRQERIAWWDQKRLYEARILVVGAGALGNEVLKNLALLGIGYIYVVDFDTIEDSNLSRAVLFRTADAKEGAQKAAVAAERAKALNPNPHAVVQFLHGDVVWDLGYGIFRNVDLVIGCLDNLEARLTVNLNCWRTNTPWIDGGLWEFSGSVAVYDASAEQACYECSMTPDHYRQAKQRYSCTNQTVRTRLEQGYAPTTQTVSAVIAAIQCQEAIKLLHGLPSFAGKRLVFNGDSRFYTDPEFSPMVIRELAQNPDCLCHSEDRFTQPIESTSAFAHQTTARQLFSLVEDQTGLKGLVLELERTFVMRSVCGQCNSSREINRPLYRTLDLDVVCLTCEVTCPTCGTINVGRPDCANCGQTDINEPRLEMFHSLSPTDPEVLSYLDYSLYDLGIPFLHILTLASPDGNKIHVELTGDAVELWHPQITHSP
jgi:adenylyltransferase/sulfurtransferase